MISVVHSAYSAEGDTQRGLPHAEAALKKLNNTTKKSPSASISEGDSYGADTRIRTGDLILTKDALYRLSYISIGNEMYSSRLCGKLQGLLPNFLKFFCEGWEKLKRT